MGIKMMAFPFGPQTVEAPPNYCDCSLKMSVKKSTNFLSEVYV